MRKGGYSRLGVFGTMNHYDNSGYKIGESRPGLFGSVNTYDSSGDRISRMIDDKIRAVAEEFCMNPEDILGYVLEYRIDISVLMLTRKN